MIEIPGLGEDDENDRLETACHELAHVAAAIACESHILRVEVRKATKGRGFYGTSHSMERTAEHEAFVWLVGYVYEELTQECPHRADRDLDQGRRAAQHAGLEWAAVLDRAYYFIGDPEVQLATFDGAVAFLAMVRRDGKMQGAKLAALCRWLRPRLPTYASLK